MALVALALACTDGAEVSGRSYRLTCQFGGPAHPGDTVTISMWDARTAAGAKATAFNASTARGVALKNAVLVPGTSVATATVTAHV